MTILTKTKIQEAITKGRLTITPPLQPNQINGASIDLTLGNEFRLYKKRATAIDVQESTNYRRYTTPLHTTSILLQPQETVLGITREKIILPENIVGWLEGRSRFARLGLLIHISAGLVHPGVNNHQVLEITNLSPNILKLHAGTRICQLILEELDGATAYRGRYRHQIKP